MTKETSNWSDDCWTCSARRDHEGVFEFYDPDIEWDTTAWKSTAVDAGVGGIAGLAGVYRGRGGV